MTNPLGDLNDMFAEFDDYDVWDSIDDEPEYCPHCGKEYEDFSDIGCRYCDRRSPDFGVL